MIAQTVQVITERTSELSFGDNLILTIITAGGIIALAVIIIALMNLPKT